MDNDAQQEQEIIRKSAHDFLARECPLLTDHAARTAEPGFSQDLWQAMAELGWQGLLIPARFGGSAAGFQQLCILLEEQGRVLHVSPFLTTTAHCTSALVHFGTPEQQQRLLPSIAAGDCIMSYAAVDPGDPWQPSRSSLTAQRQGNSFLLSGEKHFVPFAPVANCLLVVATIGGQEQQGPGLFLVDTDTKGICCEPLETVGPERLYRIVFDQVKVAKKQLLGETLEGRQIVEKIEQWGSVARCAEMVGGAQQVLEMSAEYSRQRRAFGRRIGSFQAIQHHCANMAMDVLSSRLMTCEAAYLLDRQADAMIEVAAAKAWVSDAYQRICALGHQIHGAIGFTGEHPMSHFYRYAKAQELAHGDAAWHRERVAQALGL